jgi:hypothetical protein
MIKILLAVEDKTGIALNKIALLNIIEKDQAFLYKGSVPNTLGETRTSVARELLRQAALEWYTKHHVQAALEWYTKNSTQAARMYYEASQL